MTATESAPSSSRSEYLKAWRANNPAKTAEYRKRQRARKTKAQWYEAHREEVAEYNRRYREANPEAKRRGNQKYRARKIGNFVEQVDRAVLFDRDQGMCAICHEAVDPDNWWIEHLVPLSRGGEHSYSNTAVSHPTCNNRKNTRLLSELSEADRHG